MSAVVPRQNALGSRKRGGRDRNGERAAKRLCQFTVNLLMGNWPISRFTVKGKCLLAARVRLNAVAQWHSRCECPWMKHGETAGTGGNENMKGVGIAGIQT